MVDVDPAEAAPIAAPITPPIAPPTIAREITPLLLVFVRANDSVFSKKTVRHYILIRNQHTHKPHDPIIITEHNVSIGVIDTFQQILPAKDLTTFKQ